MNKYREISPGARLARYVECYWSGEDSRGTPDHCVLPDGCVDILFSARNGEPLGLSVVGLMTTRQKFDLPAGQSFFGVRFRPGMATAFIPEAARLNDKMEPLENVSGMPGGDLFEKLAESASPDAMTRVMESFLRPLEPPDAAQKVLEHLSLGELSVERLALEGTLSMRQLRRVCFERAGVSPKYLMRILRFRRVAERIGAAAKKSVQPHWAQLAAANGYFDQAHLIREFQEFGGCTPGRFLQSFPADVFIESNP